MSPPARHLGVTRGADPSSLEWLGEWLTRNLSWLKRQIRRPERSEADLDDLIQDAMLRVAESCERQEIHDSAGLLVRTVTRLSMNDCRDRERHPASENIEETESIRQLIDPSPLPEDLVALEQSWALIEDILQSVDPRTRLAFRLSRIQGLSYAEVGRQLGVSMSTVEKDVAWVMTLLIDAARDRKS